MAAEEATAPSDKAASYLRQPYARMVVPEIDGTYRGEILEFPGCIATGDTPAETLTALEEVAAEWLEAALERNQPIPAPVENTAFSGRLVLRMPKSLHKKAARLAEHDGVSLNQFIVTSLAEYVGEQAKAQNQITFSAVTSNLTVGAVGIVSEHTGTQIFGQTHFSKNISPQGGWISAESVPNRNVR
jgi:predicted RNase H-like HicB family nuclease